MPSKTARKRYRLWHVGSGIILTGPNGNIPTYVEEQRISNVAANDTLVTAASLPTWRADIRRGSNATTELHGVRFSRKQKYGTVSYRHTGGQSSRWSGQLLWNDVALPSTVDSSLITKADNAAIADFVKTYRSRSRDFQAIPFFGEFREMVHSVARPSKVLFRELANVQEVMLSHMAREIVKGGPRRYRIRQLLRDLSDTWLEWQFGLKPTLLDLEDALKAARHLSTGRTFDNVRIRGKGESKSASVIVKQSGYNAGHTLVTSAVNVDVVTNDSCSVWYEFAFKAGTPSQEMPIPATIGTTLSDFVPGLYEIVPYSWLFDYFSNLGGILDAWSLGSVEWSWGQRTTRSSRTVHGRSMRPVKPFTSVGGFQTFTEAAGGELKLSRTHVDRIPLTSVPVPTFEFTIPGMGSTRWLNLMAFVTGRASARRMAARF